MIIWEDITRYWNEEFGDDCPKVEEFESDNCNVQIFHNNDGLYAYGTTGMNKSISIEKGNVKALAEEWINEQMQ